MTYPGRFQGAPRTMQIVGEKGGGPKWLEDHATKLEQELVEACLIIRMVIRNNDSPAADIARKFIDKLL